MRLIAATLNFAAEGLFWRAGGAACFAARRSYVDGLVKSDERVVFHTTVA